VNVKTAIRVLQRPESTVEYDDNDDEDVGELQPLVTSTLPPAKRRGLQHVVPNEQRDEHAVTTGGDSAAASGGDGKKESTAASHVHLVPAPPPTVNVWHQRAKEAKETTTAQAGGHDQQSTRTNDFERRRELDGSLSCDV
jgi:hypothetical protein